MYRSRVSYETKLERDEEGTREAKKRAGENREIETAREGEEGGKKERKRKIEKRRTGRKVDETGGESAKERGEAEGARKKSRAAAETWCARRNANDESANTHRPPGARAYPAGSPTRSLGQLTSSSSAARVT